MLCVPFNALHQLMCYAATKAMTFKSRLESLEGRELNPAELAAMWETFVKLSGMPEAVTETCILACNYVHDHIFRHSVLRSKALEADAILGTNNPWNSVYKLKARARKAKRVEDGAGS